MDIIKQQLEALRPEIDRTLQISGAPALSLGVLHQGTIIRTAHFGRRNAEESTPPNDDTIYWIASLTKLVTAAAVAKLVHEEKLDWDVPIREYLPAFRIRRDELGLQATIRDLMSNRAGIAPVNNLWGFQNSEPLMKKSETTFTATCLKVNMQRGKTGFVLSPYDGDTFYWPVNREEETCEKGMWGFMYKDWHVFRFDIDGNKIMCCDVFTCLHVVNDTGDAAVQAMMSAARARKLGSYATVDAPLVRVAFIPPQTHQPQLSRHTQLPQLHKPAATHRARAQTT